MAGGRPQMLIATESFAVETGRREDDTPIMVIVQSGITRLPANNPIVKGREHLFAPTSGPVLPVGDSSE
jgi:hypothetical protein